MACKGRGVAVLEVGSIKAQFKRNKFLNKISSGNFVEGVIDFMIIFNKLALVSNLLPQM